MTRLPLKNTTPRLLPLLSALTLLAATTARGVTVFWGAEINNMVDPDGNGGLPSANTTAYLIFYGNDSNMLPGDWNTSHDPTSTGFFANDPNVFDRSGLTQYYVDYTTGNLMDGQGNVLNDSISGPFFIEHQLTFDEYNTGSLFYDPNGSTGAGNASSIEVADAVGYWRILIYDETTGTYGLFDYYSDGSGYVYNGSQVTLPLDYFNNWQEGLFIEIGVIPEPSAALLIVLGAAVFGLRRRKFHRSAGFQPA